MFQTCFKHWCKNVCCKRFFCPKGQNFVENMLPTYAYVGNTLAAYGNMLATGVFWQRSFCPKVKCLLHTCYQHVYTFLTRFQYMVTCVSHPFGPSWVILSLNQHEAPEFNVSTCQSQSIAFTPHQQCTQLCQLHCPTLVHHCLTSARGSQWQCQGASDSHGGNKRQRHCQRNGLGVNEGQAWW